MSLFSWLSGKKKEEQDPIPSDYIIASKIASLIDHILSNSTKGLTELLKPGCAAVLDTRGGVSLRWLSPSKPEAFKDIVTYALIADLPNFKSFAKSYVEMAKTQDATIMTLWFQSIGRIEVDQIANQALQEMKSNAQRSEQHRRDT